MPRYAVIKNEKVLNVYVSDSPIENSDVRVDNLTQEPSKGWSYDGKVFLPIDDFVQESKIKEEAKKWRNQELKDTDWLVPVADHPQRAAYLVYRQALRDWPSTSEFPDTRPTLGV